MAFGTITAADVEAHLSAGELADFRSHSAQIEDPLPTIIADATSMVRGYLATRYTLTEAGVPAELRAVTIDLIVHRLVKRVSSSIDDAREAAANRALTTLRDAADGKFGSFGDGIERGHYGSLTRFDPI
jgi:phage gp36-like protein